MKYSFNLILSPYWMQLYFIQWNHCTILWGKVERMRKVFHFNIHKFKRRVFARRIKNYVIVIESGDENFKIFNPTETFWCPSPVSSSILSVSVIKIISTKLFHFSPDNNRKNFIFFLVCLLLLRQKSSEGRKRKNFIAFHSIS